MPNLKNVLDAQEVVEKTYDLVTNNIYELTSILCEMQDNIQLSEAQVNELKTEVQEQENKYTKRTEENDEAIRESNKLLVKWEYTSPPEPTPPPPVAYPPPTQRRRFVAVDGFKPKV